MCISPYLIENPNYGHHLSRIYKRSSWKYDTTSSCIYVPCGHCKECIALKQMYLVQRAQMEAHNSFMFFSTLTYSNKFLPSVEFEDSGISIPYVSHNDLHNLFDRLYHDNSFGRPFRYLACSERGGEKGRPHVHILWFLPIYEGEDYIDGLGLQKCLYDSILKYWSRNVGSRSHPKYECLLDYREKWRNGRLYRNYDTHFVTPSLTSNGISDVCFYVCKYLLKGNEKERRLQQALRLNYSEEDYESFWKIVRSRSFRSSSFGLGGEHNAAWIVDYLKKGISLSKGSSPFPYFFSPDSHKTFPLAKYYREKPSIYTERDWMDFHMFDDSVIVPFDKNYTQISNCIHEFERAKRIVDSKDFSLEFDWIDD